MGREPTNEEIAEEMGTNPERVCEAIRISKAVLSLDSPIGEEAESQLGDFVEDREVTPPPEAASGTMLRTEVAVVLHTLSPRERRVLQLRFGLVDGRECTLGEVGKRWSVTPERIRQIEAEALCKLRHPSRIARLIDFLE